MPDYLIAAVLGLVSGVGTVLALFCVAFFIWYKFLGGKDV